MWDKLFELKKYGAAIVAVLVFAAAFAAYRTGGASDVKFIDSATGTIGGTYYPVGSVIAKIWNDAIPGVKVNSQSTGGTVQNISLLRKGESDVCFSDGLCCFAYEGKGPYQGNPVRSLRALTPLYPEALHFVAVKGSGIKSLKDLKGKRVSIGAVGSGNEATNRVLLEANGIDPDKDIKAENLGHTESASAIEDRNIDAFITGGSLGIASVVEVVTLGVAEVIELRAEEIKRLCEALPYYVPFEIPAGTYEGQEKTLNTAATWNILVVTDKLDDKLVFEMTKALFENKMEIITASPMLDSMDPKNLKYVGIPLHPGAEMYYREIGAIR